LYQCVQPAFGHHPLGGEVDDDGRLHLIDQSGQLAQLGVEINGLKSEIVSRGHGLPGSRIRPSVGQEHCIRLGRPAHPPDLMASLQSLCNEMGATEAVAADNQDFL
jgi:hypothetical protein